MGSNLPFFDIILLAAVAVFLVLRLRSTLGKRTGFDEKPDHDPFSDRGENDNVVNLPRREDRHSDDSQFLDSGDTSTKEIRTGSLHGGKVAVDVLPSDSALAEGLSAIQMSDRSFDPAEFVQGAGAAFEMIIGSFASGDTKTLRNLLDDEVYHDFKSAIDEREALKQTHETVMVGINDVDIIEAEMSGRHAVVTVKFVSEQVNVTRDANGNTVSGDSNHVAKVTDIWTFTRDTRSKDPNWLLVETRSPN
ncbi:Tim44/TimA family putative adaptor protein [Kiloniella sp. EL199]|uniref:Tim44/TimA family putative adaptor protein n=1 Tax=Kiloniella sp. EL199 TaxID=2107581 RepID=UPI000EA0B3C4|nr:Tim44/TimA family putative adaptor protein [Kiloniella sp. EL199]